ncbi:MAG: hypothetical protein HY851_06730 [candidate division Zixibacteria bacterium]|nr:hypothetical protein [candidate division Zixibacteria bacterium]
MILTDTNTDGSSPSGTKSAGWCSPLLMRTGVLLIALVVILGLLCLAFVHFDIRVDEAWLGQQVYSLVTHGEVRSEFFRDKAPLDGKIVLYHTLLIWMGAAASWLTGWGLYTLRAVSVVAGLLLAASLFWFRPFGMNRRIAALAALLLLITPLYFRVMLIFRPEMLLTLLGFLSFVLVDRGVIPARRDLLFFAGLCAGCSGATHALGLSFALAGGVVLLVYRRFRVLAWFIAGSLIGFAPYVAGFFTDRSAFLDQAFHNPLIQSDIGMHWYQPVVNLLGEHTRWFRNFESIGISVLFVLAILLQRRESWHRNRLFWIFFGALAIAIAIAPIPKTSRYLVLMAPFMISVIAASLTSRSPSVGIRSKLAGFLLPVWAIVFVCSGVVSLGREAFSQGSHRIATNHQLAAHLVPGSLVMAPFDFTFSEQPNFVVQSYRGAQLTRRSFSPDELEAYADSLSVKYLIFSSEEVLFWGIDTLNLASQFSRYSPVSVTGADERWLMKKIGLP